jgi:hypothetical protein
MAAEANEGQGFIPLSLGQLTDVARTAPTVNLTKLVYRTGSSDWGPLAPGAAIAQLAGGADLATTVTKVNAILTALAAQGVILP